jgi:hypothetical protein
MRADAVAEIWELVSFDEQIMPPKFEIDTPNACKVMGQIKV